MARWIGPEDDVVVVQALALAALAWPGRGRWRLPPSLAVLACGATATGTALGLLAAAPHANHLTPRVEPPEDLELLRDGVYALSRNPMYTGLLLATGGWAVLRRRPEPMLAWAALAGVLHAKTHREEALLNARFGAEYERYRIRTPRFAGRPRPGPHAGGSSLPASSAASAAAFVACTAPSACSGGA
jgi:protein-S-isoprenylcysteine O-methyltransferase Ste14